MRYLAVELWTTPRFNHRMKVTNIDSMDVGSLYAGLHKGIKGPDRLLGVWPTTEYRNMLYTLAKTCVALGYVRDGKIWDRSVWADDIVTFPVMDDVVKLAMKLTMK